MVVKIFSLQKQMKNKSDSLKMKHSGAPCRDAGQGCSFLIIFLNFVKNKVGSSVESLKCIIVESVKFRDSRKTNYYYYSLLTEINPLLRTWVKRSIKIYNN